MEMYKKKLTSKRSTGKKVENPAGIIRTTMSYNDRTMMCHFKMKRGATIPLHQHEAVQNGYVISGHVKFVKGDGSSFFADTGSGYLFNSNEPHGAEILEDSEIVECFSPMRPEYTDG